MIGLKYSGDAFEFRKCTLENLDSICEIQEIAFRNLQNEDILRRNSREMLAACLDEPHYTLGVFYENVLVAFAILFDGGKSAENIGWDIGVSEQDINFVINFKLVIVLPEFRGNKLQKRLISKLEEIAREKNKKIICATVSPLNSHSCENFKATGFKFHSNKTKYNGLNRDIYFKELN